MQRTLLFLVVLLVSYSLQSDIKVQIALKQHNIQELERLLVEEISNPLSSNYGHFLTPAQIAQYVGAEDHVIDSIVSEIRALGAERVQVHPNRDWIIAYMPNEVLDRENWENQLTQRNQIEFVNEMRDKSPLQLHNNDGVLTVEENIPPVLLANINKQNLDLIIASRNIYSLESVSQVVIQIQFESSNARPVELSVAPEALKCSPCSQFRSPFKLSSFFHGNFCNLIGNSNSLVCQYEEQDIVPLLLQYSAENQISTNKFTILSKIIYKNGKIIEGNSEILDLATVYWDPNSQKAEYEQPTNLVGDSSYTQIVWGTGSYGYSTNDLSQFYNQYEIPTTSSYVQAIGEVGNPAGDNWVEATLDIQYITAFGPQVGSACVNTDNSTNAEGSTGFGNALLDFSLAITASADPPNVISMSLGSLSWDSCNIMCTQVQQMGVSTYAQCLTYVQSQFQVCMYTSADQVSRISNEFMKMGTQGVSLFGAAGDGGNHFSFGAFNPFGADSAIARALNQISCNYTLPTFPAASPWVTAVGATQMIQSGSSYNPVGCSTKTGGVITGGCGFSWQFPMPSYQQTVVTQYLSAHSSVNFGNFNASGRAYPDISAIGSSIPIINGGNVESVSGTSCSTPTVAGLFSLINSARAGNNLPALGFINTRLYQAAATQSSSMFVDVTSGDSNCGIGLCCSTGFVASAGWDAFTGFGNPLYPGLLAAFSS